MAAPFVAGLAGLLLSKNPDLTKEELIQLIKENVEPVVTDTDKPIGTGRINVKGAMEQVAGSGGSEELKAVAYVNEEGQKEITVNVGEEVQFIGDQSQVPQGYTLDDLQFQWDFGDGETSNEMNPTHTYQEVGSYTVILVVSIGESSSSDSVTVKVKGKKSGKNQPPIINAIHYEPQEPAPGEEITFTADAKDPDGQITKYEWDFGDGNIAEGEEVKHTYEDEGTYTVKLTVTDDKGATAEKTVELNVGIPEDEIWIRGKVEKIVFKYEYEEGIGLSFIRIPKKRRVRVEEENPYPNKKISMTVYIPISSPGSPPWHYEYPSNPRYESKMDVTTAGAKSDENGNYILKFKDLVPGAEYTLVFGKLPDENVKYGFMIKNINKTILIARGLKPGHSYNCDLKFYIIPKDEIWFTIGGAVEYVDPKELGFPYSAQKNPIALCMGIFGVEIYKLNWDGSLGERVGTFGRTLFPPVPKEDPLIIKLPSIQPGYTMRNFKVVISRDKIKNVKNGRVIVRAFKKEFPVGPSEWYVITTYGGCKEKLPVKIIFEGEEIGKNSTFRPAVFVPEWIRRWIKKEKK
jgi:PKD repeat protein